MGEDSCCQTWNSVFDVWILLGGITELTPNKLSSDLRECCGTCAHIHN